MPIYDFLCPKCHKTYTLLLKFDNRNSHIDCDDCLVELERQISYPAAVYVRTDEQSK